jgi:branched-chain amino acid transport system substrate-binding protein
VSLRSLAARTLAAAALAGLLLGGCRQEEGTIRIAVALSPPTYLGAELAAREINAAGGVRGARISLEGPGVGGSEPMPTSPSGILDLARGFATDPGIVAVVGHSDSRSTLSASAVYNQHGLPQIVTIATHPAITNIGDWTYRLCISDAQQGPALARYATESWGKRRIVVVHVNDDYGRGLAGPFQEEVRRLGGEVVATVLHRQPMEADDRATVRRELARLAAMPRPPDLLALFQRAEDASWTASALREAGLDTDVLGGDNLGRSAFLATDPELKEGFRVSQFFLVGDERPATRRFVRAYRELTGEPPDYGHAFAYDAVYLLRRAIEEEGATRVGIKSYLDRLIAHGTPVEGAAGAYTLAPDHDARREIYIAEIENGEFRPIATLPTGERLSQKR